MEPEKTGRHRFFGEVQDWVMQNSALQALVRLKSSFIYENLDIPARKGLDAKRNFNQMSHFMRIGKFHSNFWYLQQGWRNRWCKGTGNSNFLVNPIPIGK